MKNNLTFWVSIGSTYTYLTALRLSKFIRYNDFDISFKIINIRWIMKKMDNVPFPPSKPSKVNYMWKDIQRRAEIYQIPILVYFLQFQDISITHYKHHHIHIHSHHH